MELAPQLSCAPEPIRRQARFCGPVMLCTCRLPSVGLGEREGTLAPVAAGGDAAALDVVRLAPVDPVVANVHDHRLGRVLDHLG